MSNVTAAAESFGYLSIIETAAGGLVGGYLLVCASGRPLEFHCTEAVSPTRAQQILFGPTLAAYIRGEVIGATLIRTASRRPTRLLIDDQVLSVAGRLTGTPTTLLDAELSDPPESLRNLADAIDLDEPFTRIREAVAETMRFESSEDRHAA